MKPAIRYMLAAVIGFTGAGFALAHYMLWNDPGAAIVTLGGAALAAAMLAPDNPF